MLPNKQCYRPLLDVEDVSSVPLHYIATTRLYEMQVGARKSVLYKEASLCSVLIWQDCCVTTIVTRLWYLIYLSIVNSHKAWSHHRWTVKTPI